MFVAHGRCREHRWKCLACLALYQKFAGPAFAGGAALEDLTGVLAQERGRCQVFDLLADCFIWRPSIKLLGEGIPENHLALRIRRDNSLLHRVE